MKINTPAHYMTTQAVVGQKEPIAVLVYGTDGNKCHTIYGDVLLGDLVTPTLQELHFIHEASEGNATTKIDRIRLGIKSDGCWNCVSDNCNYEMCKSNINRPRYEYKEDGETWLKVDKTFICPYFKKK